MSEYTERLESIIKEWAANERYVCSQVLRGAVDRIAELEAELQEEKLQHGFTNISLDFSKSHLEQCEAALAVRDVRIAELQHLLDIPKGG